MRHYRQRQIEIKLKEYGIKFKSGIDLISPYWRIQVPEWSNHTGEMVRTWHDVTHWTDKELQLGFKDAKVSQ